MKKFLERMDRARYNSWDQLGYVWMVLGLVGLHYSKDTVERWREAVWVCPTCARRWTVQKTSVCPPAVNGEYPIRYRGGGSFWTWWPLDAFTEYRKS